MFLQLLLAWPKQPLVHLADAPAACLKVHLAVPEIVADPAVCRTIVLKAAQVAK